MRFELSNGFLVVLDQIGGSAGGWRRLQQSQPLIQTFRDIDTLAANLTFLDQSFASSLKISLTMSSRLPSM